VRGVRFNYVRRLVDPEPDSYYRRIVEKIAPLGWHVVIYFEATELRRAMGSLHLARDASRRGPHGPADVSQPVDGPEFDRFLRLMGEHENFWSKVSVPRTTLDLGTRPTTTWCPSLGGVIQEFPDRVLWGTDWPTRI